MIYKTFDVVIVPFPFVDRGQTKNRPALVLSAYDFNQKSGHTVLAMITSAKHTRWDLDMIIDNLAKAGLSKASMVRMKLFTLDNRLIKDKIGNLSLKDSEKLSHSISELFVDLFNR